MLSLRSLLLLVFCVTVTTAIIGEFDLNGNYIPPPPGIFHKLAGDEGAAGEDESDPLRFGRRLASIEDDIREAWWLQPSIRSTRVPFNDRNIDDNEWTWTNQPGEVLDNDLSTRKKLVKHKYLRFGKQLAAPDLNVLTNPLGGRKKPPGKTSKESVEEKEEVLPPGAKDAADAGSATANDIEGAVVADAARAAGANAAIDIEGAVVAGAAASAGEETAAAIPGAPKPVETTTLDKVHVPHEFNGGIHGRQLSGNEDIHSHFPSGRKGPFRASKRLGTHHRASYNSVHPKRSQFRRSHRSRHEPPRFYP